MIMSRLEIGALTSPYFLFIECMCVCILELTREGGLLS